MSKLRANIGEAVYKINKWLGLNENPDGDNNLAKGEAAVMRNFRITDGDILKRRPGTRTLAGLLQSYTYEVDESQRYAMFADDGGEFKSMYSGISIDSVGIIYSIGEGANVNAENHASYIGWYHQVNGDWYAFAALEGNPEEGESYIWYFYKVEIKANDSADTAVRGLWSGFVGEKEYIVAACNGYLWSLKEEDGAWEKSAIGPVNTDKRVCLFGFGGKLYCLDKLNYWRWDGVRLEAVEGYVPIVASASTPEGGGTLLERVNMLTAKRRQRFNADGESVKYQLIEKNLASVDKVIIDGEVYESWVADPESGLVSFTAAPAEGTDNVEIWYSASEDYRDKIATMGYAEFYNGATDNRVFLYGDGTNICRYSDIEFESGAPSAEYFPDLNEMAIGDANTPITAMIRQYSRLMAFKRGGGAWSIYYSETALADGTITAGFYCAGVNKDIGCDGMGQAVLCENKPRTADGVSIYEWQAASGGNITNDQRNAKRISQKVEKTLRGFDLQEAKLFFDKIHHEFYCIYKGTAIIQNTENDAWYVYTEFPAEELILYKDELYYGTSTGALRRVSDDYTNDDGDNIDAVWESGSMSFGMDYVYKYSPEIWVGLKQERGALIWLGISTDMGDEAYEFVSAMDLRDMPTSVRRRLKARRFTHYKLRLFLDAASARATVSSVDIRVKYNKNVN